MIRELLLILVYAVIGAATTLVGYRIVLGGPVSGPDAEGTLDGLIAFISVALNSVLALAAAGVVAVMIFEWKRSIGLAAAASAVTAGAVGLGMKFWFPGLNLLFPLVMAGSALICAGLGRVAGLVRPREG
jgi:hypothetical protein